MNAIVCAAMNNGIGKEGALLYHIREDLKRFQTLTTGGTVIMGRKTLESLPGGRPLAGRRNIVLTRNPSFRREGVETVPAMTAALSLIEEEHPDTVWLIGGGEIYRQYLTLCRFCYMTRVYENPECDVFFPDLDAMPSWSVYHSGAAAQSGKTAYRFVEYRNTALG